MQRATDDEVKENYKKFCEHCAKYPCKDSNYIFKKKEIKK